MAAIDTRKFLVRSGAKVRLGEWPTLLKPLCDSKQDYRQRLMAHKEKLQHLQTLLYANNTWSLLLIFQGMDAAGKDSAIKHVMSGVDPQGCQVHSFKKPNSEELSHDFLWRCARRLPERGRIGIFNRSHYEEALVPRLRPEVLAAQRIPGELLRGRAVWEDRFRSMVDWEAHLHRNGTRVLKFFLHLSREEQRRRFLKRIEDPEKNWKWESGDLEERSLWTRYHRAYEDCLAATSTRDAPWYIVPADRKDDTRLIVSKIIRQALESLRLDFPRPTAAHLRDLRAARRLLRK